MRNLLALVGAALIAFLAVGYYCNWYEFESTKGKFGIRVDPAEIKDDLGKARQQLQTTVDAKTVGTPVQPASQPGTGTPTVITPASNTKGQQPETSWIIKQW